MGKARWQGGGDICTIFVLCLVICVFTGVDVANTQTMVYGIQSGVWSAEKNPYIINDDVIVPQGLTLTIEPGVIVKFNGPFRFIVAGALIARGNPANYIVFTSIYDEVYAGDNNSATYTSNWYGIDFTDTSDDFLNVIDYCIIRYCKYGIRCRNAYPILTNIIFSEIARPLIINNSRVPIQAGVQSDYLTASQRPQIKPVPEPPPETEEEKQKRRYKEIMAARLKAREDSIRRANKIKPTNTSCGILILDAHDIERLGFDSFPEIISFLPGFINMASYMEGSILTARGIFPGQFNNKFQLRVNGVPIYDGLTNSNFFEFIPVNSISKIIIERGPGGASYGKNAFAGVVNIITKQDAQPVQMLTATEIGSYYTKKIDSYLGFSKGIYDFCIGTSYRDDNGYWRQINADELGNRFRLKYEDDNYNFLLASHIQDVQLVASYYKQQQYHLGIIPINKYSGLTEREGLFVNLNYKRKLNELFSGEISGRYQYTSQQSEAGELGAELTNTEPPNFTYSRGHILYSEIKINYLRKEYPAAAGITVEREDARNILALLDEKNGAVISDWNLDEKLYVNEFSAFIQSSYDFSPFLGTIARLRWNYAGKDCDPFFAPDIRFIYNPYLPFHVQFSYREGYRSPSLWERRVKLQDILYSPDRLKAEKIQTAEITFDYQITPPVQFGFSSYWENISDLIIQRELTEEEKDSYHATAGYIFDNSELEYQVLGCEIDFKAKITKGVSFFINSAYQQLKDRIQKKRILYWPEIVGNMGLYYQFNKKLSTALLFQYIGKQMDNEIGNTIKPCYLLNLRVGMNILPGISVEVMGNNLLDAQCSYAEYNRRKIPSIPGGYPRAIFVLLKSKY